MKQEMVEAVLFFLYLLGVLAVWLILCSKGIIDKLWEYDREKHVKKCEKERKKRKENEKLMPTKYFLLNVRELNNSLDEKEIWFRFTNDVETLGKVSLPIKEDHLYGRPQFLKLIEKIDHVCEEFELAGFKIYTPMIQANIDAFMGDFNDALTIRRMYYQNVLTESEFNEKKDFLDKDVEAIFERMVCFLEKANNTIKESIVLTSRASGKAAELDTVIDALEKVL